MFDSLFEFIDKISNILGTALEEGYLYIIVIIGFFLLILTVILIGLIAIRGQENIEEIPAEKQAIINNALSFCLSKGFNSWNWVNESENRFNCTNTTSEEIPIDKYFQP